MAIVRTEAYFNSSNGINKIRTLIWKDDELTPRGVFQIAHGMAEHIGRYDEFAKYIASNGFVVCGNDHLGHGKSVNDISELGFIAEKNGDKRLVDDMHILTKIMKRDIRIYRISSLATAWVLFVQEFIQHISVTS